MSRRFPLGVSATPDCVSQLVGFYDFIEPPGSRVLMGLEDDETYNSQQRPALSNSPLPVRAFNVLFPSELKLVGDQVDWERVERYLERVVTRATDLGAKILVFGSGGARSIPAGFSAATAWGQLVRVLLLGARYADSTGIVFAIEALRRAESNVINNFAEALQLARDVDRPSVRVLADIFHFVEEDEPLADIREGRDWLVHVHLAGEERRYPGYGTYPLQELFDLLAELDYQGAVSIECNWGQDQQAEALYAAGYLDALLP